LQVDSVVLLPPLFAVAAAVALLPLLLLLVSLLQAAVDVVLGDSAVLSRQHCRIIYNFTTKKWQLVVEVGV
jgi:hypothetical protein